MNNRRPTSYNIPLGILRMALGKWDGLALIPSMHQTFRASFYPWVAFALMLLLLQYKQPLQAAVLFFLQVCLFLLPAVVSEFYSKLWKRQSLWLRYATAYNWCRWALTMLILGVILFLPALNIPENGLLFCLALVVVYSIWFMWSLGRKALSLNRKQATILLVSIYAADLAVTLLAMIFLNLPVIGLK